MGIDPAKFREYKEVAALVCYDLDLLLEISRNSNLTIDELREEIERIHSQKELLIKDQYAREMKYDAVLKLLAFLKP